jgi:phosphopantothenoylcysteine decarboxylase / phosphopantothenate---cysteine ligase
MALIALGVTGGIGAYKAVEVVRGLQKRGHEVVAIMTRGARQFVGPLTFEAITRRRVITDQWAPGLNAEIEHIALTTEASLLVVAPATANTIAKFAHGIADDFLTSFYLATRAPVLLAPAMNTNMLEHPAMVRNLAALRERGVHLVEPGSGYLACGWTGKGRLAEPEAVVDAAVALLAPADSPLRGTRVLVTGGPTYEDIDPVRFVGNRSSGRMGIALADEARRRGAQVSLVLGPSSLSPQDGVRLERVRSAAEMHAAVLREAEAADVIIMSAAVADYTVSDGRRPQKVSKAHDQAVTLTLVPTPDILAELGKARAGRVRPILVGFAAETEDLLPRSRAKLASKQVDLIVANDVSRPDAGFDVETNAATLISKDAETELAVQSKQGLAAVILDRVEALWRERADAG